MGSRPDTTGRGFEDAGKLELPSSVQKEVCGDLTTPVEAGCSQGCSGFETESPSSAATSHRLASAATKWSIRPWLLNPSATAN